MRFLLLVIFSIFTLSLNVSAMDHKIHITDPWVRLVPSVVKNSSGYAMINNMTDKDITLIAVKSNIASNIEIHDHFEEGGMMRMKEVEGGLVIPAKGMVHLKPGSFNIMLMGLNQKLSAKETYTFVLVFDNGMEVSVEFLVKNAEMEMSGSEMTSHDH